MSLDLHHLQTWVGNTESQADVLSATPIHALAATLDRDDPPAALGDAIPPCGHWLYFLPLHRQSEIGADGHAQRGGFLPPVSLPRRMWAGGRLEFLRPLRIGDAVTKTSRIVAVCGRQGRSGPLVFVRVRHEIGDAEGAAVIDEQDIVFRDHPGPADGQAPAQPAPSTQEWMREIVPDDVLLFRYSALTFNGHRIHYDRRYATEVEGYPGLVVHGPLIATLLLDLLRHHLPGATVARFSFRAIKPTFDIAPFQLCGRPAANGHTVALWARQADGALAMDATATLGGCTTSATQQATQEFR